MSIEDLQPTSHRDKTDKLTHGQWQQPSADQADQQLQPEITSESCQLDKYADTSNQSVSQSSQSLHHL